MKMQIWKVHVSEGVMGAIHGQSFSIYEGFVPELKLTVNHITSFVNEDEARYQKKQDGEDQLVETPDPEMICEIELSLAQIKDLKILADPENNPEERTRQIIASALKGHNLDNSDYEEEDDYSDQI